MHNFAEIRGAIYEHFHGVAACFDEVTQWEGRFAQYYTSMYLLQDTTEALIHHREKGFSRDSLQAYLELWGVLQATVIHQDALKELYEAIVCQAARTEDLDAWQELRSLRVELAGHPAKRDIPRSNPLSRMFLGRDFGNYERITYERWEQSSGKANNSNPFSNITHPAINLGQLLDRYDAEATHIGSEALQSMQRQWPQAPA